VRTFNSGRLIRRLAVGLLATAAGAVAVPGVATAAPSNTASPSVVAASTCYASSCEGKDPAVYCQGDAQTLESVLLGQALLELRYSRTCRAAWARISNAPYIEFESVPGWARVHRNSDGKEYGCTVQPGATKCYTAMVNDANVTSYAYGEWDSGTYFYSGRTASR
jgi:hypothetical protein